MNRPADTGMRLWQQRSSNATILPSPVRHSTSGFSATTWPLSAAGGNSADRPATYQAFLTRTLAITAVLPQLDGRHDGAAGSGASRRAAGRAVAQGRGTARAGVQNRLRKASW